MTNIPGKRFVPESAPIGIMRWQRLNYWRSVTLELEDQLLAEVNPLRLH